MVGLFWFRTTSTVDAGARPLKIVSSLICYNSQRLVSGQCPAGVKGYSGNYRIRARVLNYSDYPVDYGQLYYADGSGTKYRPYVHMAVFYSFYNLNPHQHIDINTTQTIVFCNSLTIDLWDSAIGGNAFGAYGSAIKSCLSLR